MTQVTFNQRKEAGGRIEKVFERFPSLGQRRKQSGTTLSGGAPTEGLAPMIVFDIFKLMQELKHQYIVILLVEQNTHKAIRFCDCHYVVERGQVALEENSSSQSDRDSLMKQVSV